MSLRSLPNASSLRALARPFAALACAAALAACGLAQAAPSRVSDGIRFTYSDPNAGSVAWAGDFNGWSTSSHPLKRGSDGVWAIVIPLPPGEHAYKFVVDGQWVADPENGATAGDFGNSIVRINPNGELAATQATSNTPYSPKIFMGGRVIGLYQASRNDLNDRFELRRPSMDIDLDFDIRVSDLLKAHFLMNINSETEDVENFRTRLNFDRGSLRFTQPKLQIFAYDNEGAGTWDDPLHLVGDVGIYGHSYGYDRQGFKVNAQPLGFDAELHYADNFKPGGTSYPGFIAGGDSSAIAGLRTRPSGAGFALVPGAIGSQLSVNAGDQNEDMFALRVRRPVGKTLTLGVLGRTDRGFNLSTAYVAEATGDSTIRTVRGRAEQEWFGGGGELSWQAPFGIRLTAEALHGVARLNFVRGDSAAVQEEWRLVAADSTGPTGTQQLVSRSEADGAHEDLDVSNRVEVGAAWTAGHGDITLRGGVEWMSHDYRVIEDGLQNSMVRVRGGWDRNWRYYLGREVKTSVDVDWFNFDYDPATPWGFQFWFPTGNFWLESGEHLVSFDRLTMLGGQDMVSFRPTLEIPFVSSRHGLARWLGRFNTVAADVQPRYAESILELGIDLTPALRFGTDSRWVKYDDPLLGLSKAYLDHFADLTYRFAQGIQVSFSFGVDPWVIDPPVNDYAYIGRDLFLFDRGANGAIAESNYFGLGQRIAEAERALEKERRLQVEAIVHF